MPLCNVLPSLTLAFFVAGSAPTFGQHTPLNWQKVTDAAGWPPRESPGQTFAIGV
jgi:hypothetical protein